MSQQQGSNLKLLIVGFICFILGMFSANLISKIHFSNPDEVVVARFAGGEIKAKEINEILKRNVEAFERNQALIGKRTMDEHIRRVILENKAKEQNKDSNQFMAEIWETHYNDPVDADKFSSFVANQGLKLDKLSKLDKDKQLTQYKNYRIMQLQNDYVLDLYNKAQVWIHPDYR